MTPEHLERHLVETLLAKIERIEKEILTTLGCPSDPVVLDRDMALGTLPPLSATNSQRVEHAWLTLRHIDFVRERMDTKPMRAIEAALLAGIYAGDAARNAIGAAKHARFRDPKKSKAGGLRRGAAQTAKAAKHDGKVRRLFEALRGVNISDTEKMRRVSIRLRTKSRVRMSLPQIRRSLTRTSVPPLSKKP